MDDLGGGRVGQAPRRALVVDDDAAIRILVSRVLERNGFTVDLASDGLEGIEKLALADYGVIVLDLMMPRLDGFGFVRYLDQYCPEKLANVIVTTAFGAGGREQICPQIHHFLEKPFDVVQLLSQAIDCCRATA